LLKRFNETLQETGNPFAMRSTIRDVSRRAGVSVGTVSNAFNAPERVSEDTLGRVMEAARQLRYRPSRAARSLAGRRSFLIGYRLPTPDTWGSLTLDAFLHSMAADASRHDLEVMLFAARPGETITDGYEDLIRREAVDGFVLSDTNYDDARVELLLDRGFPFVSFGRAASTRPFAWVDVDGAAGTAAAVRHLVERGHRRLAMVAWPEGSEVGDDRVRGFLRAVEEAALPDPPVVRVENGVDEGRAAAAELLDLPGAPTAIVTVQDSLAFGVMSEARRRGMEVGADLAVVGFDDVSFSALAEPPLSSVRQPFEEIGRLLVEMLVEQLEGAGSIRSELVRPELVVRESSLGRQR
jgi:DNA-binding LacI/PurR family transcriptional regulator